GRAVGQGGGANAAAPRPLANAAKGLRPRRQPPRRTRRLGPRGARARTGGAGRTRLRGRAGRLRGRRGGPPDRRRGRVSEPAEPPPLSGAPPEAAGAGPEAPSPEPAPGPAVSRRGDLWQLG